MAYLALILFIFSLGLNVYFFHQRKVHIKEIYYIEKKLQETINNNTHENLLLYTNHHHIQKLLIQINRLVEHNQKTVANFHKVERSMRKMLSNISHDLRTPLTVVLGYIEMLLHDEQITEEKRKSLLHTVHLKTVEVLDLIKRFFELVKLESEDSKLEISKVNVSELCRKIILDYYEILTKKEFEVSIEIPEGHMFVLGNEDAIQRILHNLISNSIKYGADGKTIEFKLTYKNDSVYIEVSDKGKGIMEIDRDRVFERLYTMEDSRNKLYQGSGLGLTITKRLVEQLGGNIFLDSIPYQKTTFTVELKRVSF
ncbi:sensor histidine kinase [Lysinibacillus sp. LZ02]|uniref:sensor histidine kinase n=1 Tax=Lysinibacillus sp. LZ02 TaxID=3420668 RepID=UPI003D36EAFE